MMKKIPILAGALGALGLLVSQGLVAQDPHQAAREVEQALALTPDLDNGRRVYQTCAVCHRPEGWGTRDGTYPQVAGQLPEVIIKQLADFRARNRDNPIMYPFAVPGTLGGVQEIADVAAYISQLPMNPANSVGPGTNLDHGERLYRDNCVDCHGEQGEGVAKEFGPLIQGQDYVYLVRQFDWIRTGKRRNANSKMVKQIRRFNSRDVSAVMDYVSRLRPPADKLAEPGWTNPDFPKFARPPMLAPSPWGPPPSVEFPAASE
jgi:cytochrome c553